MEMYGINVSNRPMEAEPNCRHFHPTFWNAFSWMKIDEFRLKFYLCLFLGDPTNNIPALVQVMVWRWQGDKPLSEAMVVRLPSHICVTQPPWVEECLAEANTWRSKIIKIKQIQSFFKTVKPLICDKPTCQKMTYFITLLVSLKFSRRFSMIILWTLQKVYESYLSIVAIKISTLLPFVYTFAS